MASKEDLPIKKDLMLPVLQADAETVGGPIDVVVISKGDGLVWIKRKHYFLPELNHRYFYRDQRFNDIDNTREEPA